MNKWIVLVGLCFFIANSVEASEPKWKSSIRNLMTKIAGENWSNKILGHKEEIIESEIDLPLIPKDVKKNTSIESYTKIQKDPTEYDRLPQERKRQFDYKFLEELFMATRKSEPRDEDLSNWMNTLDQGGSREGIYQALVLDDIYSSLEDIDEAPSDKLTEFSIAFSEKYLNQTFSSDAIRNLNLYSLKRILTEKGLDVLEVYETHDLDSLYRWYAVLSADLAKQYAPFLKSSIREDTSERYHYEWAKNMPVQHIKSEFIIKLHTVMNGLQLIN